ncbi:hypothetical protein MFRU_018g01090 [Monilinia fructicola]|nr:hypothetical protein MFRU_018g01090 [Monilinia fructicola]
MAIFTFPQPFETLRIAIVIAFLTFLIKILYRAYFTPLSKVPGPWYARLTHLVLKYHVITGRRMHYIHSLHLNFGPIVLIAPTELSCSSIPSFKEIHRISKPFLKSPWYQNFANKPAQVFNMIDLRDHSTRRKLLAHAFSKTSLTVNWEGEVRKKVTMAIDKIKRDALREEANILRFFTFMATDAVGHICFGESFETLENEQTTQYIEDLQHIGQVGGIRAEFPTLFAIGKTLRIPFLQTSEARMLEYGSIAVRNAKSHSHASPNIFRKIIAESKTENADGSLADLDIQSEAANFIVAGTDTTAITLTYLIYNVLKDRDLQKRLEDEVETLRETFDSRDVEGLELLNAVLEEALRLWGAAPGSLLRMVPKNGVHLDGYFVPEDTTVSTQAYTIHRDPEIFPDPESFQPQRWLSPAKSSQSSDFKTANHAFGAGTRTCIGVHLARMEMVLCLALFFRNCKGARIAASQTEEGMEMVNFFLIAPKGEKCLITMREGV